MFASVIFKQIQRSAFTRSCPSVLLVVFLLSGSFAHAGETTSSQTTIAVASNFTSCAKALAATFEKETGHHITLAFGSTGRHYAQIKHGAPFAAFLAADVRRPQLLEEEGLAVAGSRFTYAVGKLVLWSPDPELIDQEANILRSDNFHHLALANPRLAPYGLAAQQVLHSLGLWDELQDRIVRGENIGQTAQFVISGNAELGFVAYSQVIATADHQTGSMWTPPQSSYTPINQQAVLLQDDPVARLFLEFLRGQMARPIIIEHGYRLDSIEEGTH